MIVTELPSQYLLPMAINAVEARNEHARHDLLGLVGLSGFKNVGRKTWVNTQRLQIHSCLPDGRLCCWMNLPLMGLKSRRR